MAPPTISSIVIRLIDKIPVKVIFIILLFIPVIPYMVDVHYLNQRIHTPGRMCSPRYPGYSRVLDMPVVLPDGGVQAGGWTYPPEAMWWDSALVRGCPCSIGPCIRPCCPNGYYGPNSSWSESQDPFDFICSHLLDEESEKRKPLRVFSSELLKKVSISRRHFPTLEANCEGSMDWDADAFLTTDGQILLKKGMLEPAKYGICFNVRDDELLMVMTFVCSEGHTRDDNSVLLGRRVGLLFTVVLGTVTTLLVVTLVTYLLAPHLLPAHCSGSVVSYNIALVVFKVLQLTDVWVGRYYPHCSMYLELLTNSWSSSVVMWQGLIVYQMWNTFNPSKLRIPHRDGGNTRFILYSVTIWGSVVFVTLWCLFIPDILIYMYLQSVVLLITLCLNVSALLRLRTCLRASKVAQGPDSQRHNVKECQWTSLFLKFSLATSLDFTLIVLFSNANALLRSTQVPTNSATRYLFGLQSYFVSLRGVEIFFINVWKKKTWTILRNRFVSKNTSKIRST